MASSRGRQVIHPYIQAQFYTGKWDHLPVFEALTPCRTDRFDTLDEAVRQEGYTALRITAAMETDRRGMCALSLSSAGESQLLMDGKLAAVNHGQPPAGCTITNAVTLEAGRHEAVLIYLRNTHPPRLTLAIRAPNPLVLDLRHWLYFGCEGDWPKSWSFMGGALAPGRRMPPITYHLMLDGEVYAPDELAPDRRQAIAWSLDQDVLPIPVSRWQAGPIEVTIRHLAGKAGTKGRATAVFTRVSLRNTGTAPLLPTLCVGARSSVEIPLTRPPDRTREGFMAFDTPLAPGITAHLDFAAKAAGRVTARTLRQAPGFTARLEQLRAAFHERAADLAEPVELPDAEMAAMYRALRFATQVSTVQTARGDWEIRGSANSPGTIVQYDCTFSHDVPNMVEQLIFEGDFANARRVMESDYYQRLGRELQQDYLDAIPKFFIPYATYLLHTGDTAYFTPERMHDIRRNAHRLKEYRLHQCSEAARAKGLHGLMNASNTMDNHKDYLLVDNLAALHGLAAYHYLTERLGDTREAAWAQAQAADLNDDLNAALAHGMHRRGGQPWYHAMMATDTHALLDQPANWLMSSFMMAAFPWGAWLKGFSPSGLLLDAFDASVAQALSESRRHGCADGCWGAFWQCKYGSTYNAALGLNLLFSDAYRTMPLANLRWLLDNQSAPFQWGENFWPPRTPGDWTTPNQDYETWGLCFSRQVLQHSCIATLADGRVLIARGVPAAWLQPGKRIAWTRVPATNGRRVGFDLHAEHGSLVLEMNGDNPEGDIILQPSLLIGNIAGTEASVPVVADERTGTVTLPPACRRVVVHLRGVMADPS